MDDRLLHTVSVTISAVQGSGKPVPSYNRVPAAGVLPSHLRVSITRALIQGQFPEAVSKIHLAQMGGDPVSYTHLDVYKRQVFY